MTLFPSIPGLLSRYRPAWVLPHPFPGITLIHRLELAREVLERDSDFSVAHQGARIESCVGPALLGMPEGPEYREQLGFARKVVQRDDLARVATLLEGEGETLLDNATRYKTTLDLVTEYLDPLALRYFERYFGISDPGHGVLLRWYKMTSFYFFSLYLLNSPRVEVASLRAGKQLATHVRSLVERRTRAGDLEGDDVLSRMLRLRASEYPAFSDLELAQRLIAISSGSLVAPFGLALNALDKLLDLPQGELESGREAARHDRDDVVRDYALEAARFGPMPPIVSRYCPSGAVIGQGTAHERRIPRGSLVVINCFAVNRDASAVHDPEEFRPGRPESERMLFGHALHACFAAHLGEAILTHSIKPLLKRPLFERLAGDAGRKRSGPRLDFPEGIYAASLGVAIARSD